MKHESEVSVGRNHLQVSYPVAVTAFIFTVGCVFTLSASLFHFSGRFDALSNRLDVLAGSKLSVIQFQEWTDNLRENNEKLPVKVPAVPHLGNREAEILESRPLARMKP